MKSRLDLNDCFESDKTKNKEREKEKPLKVFSIKSVSKVRKINT